MRILVVEDEPSLRNGLVDLLKGAGHSVEIAVDGLTATKLGAEGNFDLVLLDLMLPKLDGVEVCLRLRKTRPALPILMLTARGSEEDKVRGLKVGADDYVTKPFGPRELLARIEALERRTQATPADAEVIEVDGCHIDLGHCQAHRGKKAIALSAREAGVVRWLYRHRARTVSRSELLEHIWNANPDMETRTVDMTIAHLRQKIERDPAYPAIIVSVKGVGYAWGQP
ncbi:MAG TPA: response regulator transcription factor [Verrucomicrobiae bacterium]|nr:response regulator transcription factor [Verrucomicrobiae bacterium]